MHFIEVAKETIMITCFIMVIMLIIEYINVRSSGNWTRFLKKSWVFQMLFAGLLGATPGCLGSYAIVSLYTHNILNFTSLVVAMIATYGDEALVIFSQNPALGVKLSLSLLAIGILTGIMLKLFFKHRQLISTENMHFELHNHHDDDAHYHLNFIENFKKISFQRAILLFGLLVFLFGLLGGQFSDDHCNHVFCHGSIDWVKVMSIVGSLVALVIVTIVPDHFLDEHLWGHIIKKHFLKIFLWTFGALLLVHFFLDSVNMQEWVKANHLTVIFIAMLIGLIPESGPHLIFFFMFTSGSIPFSVLLVNSIVQDGHGALPLLAESKRSFALLKLIKVIVALLVGLAGYLMGW